jgi:hypothetical protein
MMCVCADKIGIKGWEASLSYVLYKWGASTEALLEGIYEINAQGATDEPEDRKSPGLMPLMSLW